MDYIEELGENKTCMKIKTIGQSVEGRDIKLISLRKQSGKRKNKRKERKERRKGKGKKQRRNNKNKPAIYVDAGETDVRILHLMT